MEGQRSRDFTIVSGTRGHNQFSFGFAGRKQSKKETAELNLLLNSELF